MKIETVDLSAMARELAAELEQSEPARRVDWLIAEGIAAEGDPVPLQAILKQPPREVTLSGGTRITATVEMVETFRDWRFEDPAADQFAFQRPEGVRRVVDLAGSPAAYRPPGRRARIERRRFRSVPAGSP